MRYRILVAVLCFGAINLLAQPKDSPAKNETPAIHTPTPAPPNGGHKSADDTETAKSSPPHWYTSSEWWLVLIAALTGAAIAYQAGEMARTTSVMEGQLKEMQDAGKQADRQAKVLERSVAAAEKSAEAAKRSADIAVRVSIPTLVIEQFEHEDTGVADLRAMLQYPKVNIVIKNYGQTPAFLRSWSIVFTCEDLPPIPDYWNQPGHPGLKPLATGIPLERNVVQPGNTYTLPELEERKRTKFSPEDIEAIINHEKQLWCYGFVWYNDLFGNPLRRFKFCERALNVMDGWIEWVGVFSPEAYRGTDDFPLKNATPKEKQAEEQPDNPN
jgi:hypothetical protein